MSSPATPRWAAMRPEIRSRSECDPRAAFAPRRSIAPKDVGKWDRRLVENYRADLNAEITIRSEDAVTFYDPFFRDDRLNVEKIVEAYLPARLITTHLTRLFAATILARTARVLRLFEPCLAKDLRWLRRQATSNRREPARRTRVRSLMDLYLKSDPVRAAASSTSSGSVRRRRDDPGVHVACNAGGAPSASGEPVVTAPRAGPRCFVSPLPSRMCAAAPPGA